jgi:hypothetical protein
MLEADDELVRLKKDAEAIDRRQDPELAVDAWRKVLALSPDDRMAHKALSGLLRLLERPGESVPHIQALLRRTPDAAWLWEQLASSLELSGDASGAEAARREAQSLAAPPAPVQHASPSRTGVYEEEWSKVLGVVDDVIASGERSLAGAVRRTIERSRGADLTPETCFALGQTISLPRIVLYAGRQAMISQVLAGQRREDTDLVVELASGWGVNLLSLYLNGGPPKARYVGLEPTESGRECAKRLAALDPALDLTCAPFDFRAPNFAALPNGARHVLVFSCHGVEQVPALPKDFIASLLGLGVQVTGVHIEPIGWQISPDANQATYESCRKFGYNENLWTLLTGCPDIVIETAAPDVIGLKAKNASSLVIWRSR